MEPGLTLPDDDDALLVALRHVVELVDPIPEAVRIAGRAAIEWRTLEAELAALVHDSAVDADELMAVRGTVAGPRSLSFEAPELTIEVETEPDEAGGLLLVGQLVPPRAADVTVRHGGGDLVAVRADERGRFSARGVARGPVSLRCRLDEASGASRLVETAWLTV